MKNYGRRNVWKHRDIKSSDRYVTLDKYLEFGSLDKMRITSSDPNDKLGRLGKRLINSLGIKAKTSPKKHKKERYTIGNINMKEISNIIREFEKFN